jgi:preprotein translocase subunit SecD
MTTRLTRSIILSLGIALLLTAAYYWLLNETRLLKKPPKVTRYQAEVNIRLGAPGDATASTAAVQKSMAIIDERLTQVRYEHTIKPGNDKTFTISINGLTDTTGLKELLTGNGRLAMHEVYDLSVFANTLSSANNALANYFRSHPEDTLLRQNSQLSTIEYPLLSLLNPARPFTGGGGGMVYPGYIGLVAEKDTALLRQLLEHPVTMPYWPADNRFMLGNNDGYGATQGTQLVYAIKYHPPRITNKNIIRAEAEYDGITSEQVVAMDFDPAGAAEWERMTTRNINKPIAICLNNKVMSAPTVTMTITGGKSRITLGRSKDNENGKILSILLKSNELPLRVQVNQVRFSPVRPQIPAVWPYALLLMLSFVIAMAIQWLIYRLNKI